MPDTGRSGLGPSGTPGRWDRKGQVMTKKNDRRRLLEELVRALGTDCPLEALRRVAELLAVARAAEGDFAARAFNPALDKALRAVGLWLSQLNVAGGEESSRGGKE